ncbi:anti-sigma regulatory factor (Ser/Thr protein kinase) [Hamadaea flava]|uniref:ATP-binding protein n=1 Tax=Hamadaea flava TaxID=1742688 RepID=A0ABV8M006_9ACTN|nr:ATP-binding protein [Hamadaea flava]MCP2329020.1 anti-sigma regulatory factor (Ser/Thr protein kinase) [Hamadaea flava]
MSDQADGGSTADRVAGARLVPEQAESLLDIGFAAGQLYQVRQTVVAHAQSGGAGPTTVEAVLLIASELAVNAIRHGGGRGRLRLWRTNDAVYCQVEDAGPGIAEPESAGADPSVAADSAETGQAGRRGLWIVRMVADDVDIETGPAGTTVTTRVRLRGPGDRNHGRGGLRTSVFDDSRARA